MEIKKSEPVILNDQKCPMCMKNTLKVIEYTTEVPHFGTAYLFTVECSNCNFKMSDIEFDQQQDPVKWTFTIENEKDLNSMVIKSSSATVKIGTITKIEPGIGSDGYITTLEGMLMKVKEQLTKIKDAEEDKDERNKIWKLIKKLNKVLFGESKIKIIIEDPTGNSAIINEKAKKQKLSKKQ